MRALIRDSRNEHSHNHRHGIDAPPIPLSAESYRCGEYQDYSTIVSSRMPRLHRQVPHHIAIPQRAQQLAPLKCAVCALVGVDSLPSSPSYGSDGGSGLDGDCSWSGGSSDNLPSTPEGRGPAFTSVPKEASYARRMESSSTKLQGASAWSRRASGLRTSEGSDALSGIFGLSPEEMEASLLLTVKHSVSPPLGHEFSK